MQTATTWCQHYILANGWAAPPITQSLILSICNDYNNRHTVDFSSVCTADYIPTKGCYSLHIGRQELPHKWIQLHWICWCLHFFFFFFPQRLLWPTSSPASAWKSSISRFVSVSGEAARDRTWPALPWGRKETSCHRSPFGRTPAQSSAARWCCRSTLPPFSVTGWQMWERVTMKNHSISHITESECFFFLMSVSVCVSVRVRVFATLHFDAMRSKRLHEWPGMTEMKATPSSNTEDAWTVIRAGRGRTADVTHPYPAEALIIV